MNPFGALLQGYLTGTQLRQSKRDALADEIIRKHSQEMQDAQFARQGQQDVLAQQQQDIENAFRKQSLGLQEQGLTYQKEQDKAKREDAIEKELLDAYNTFGEKWVTQQRGDPRYVPIIFKAMHGRLPKAIELQMQGQSQTGGQAPAIAAPTVNGPYAPGMQPQAPMSPFDLLGIPQSGQSVPTPAPQAAAPQTGMAQAGPGELMPGVPLPQKSVQDEETARARAAYNYAIIKKWADEGPSNIAARNALTVLRQSQDKYVQERTKAVTADMGLDKRITNARVELMTAQAENAWSRAEQIQSEIGMMEQLRTDAQRAGGYLTKTGQIKFLQENGEDFRGKMTTAQRALGTAVSAEKATKQQVKDWKAIMDQTSDALAAIARGETRPNRATGLPWTQEEAASLWKQAYDALGTKDMPGLVETLDQQTRSRQLLQETVDFYRGQLQGGSNRTRTTPNGKPLGLPTAPLFQTPQGQPFTPTVPRGQKRAVQQQKINAMTGKGGGNKLPRKPNGKPDFSKMTNEQLKNWRPGQ